jgi:glycine hydroxymethyltransferase
MVDAAHFIGLVAGKAIPSPVPYADVVTYTTHKVLRGPRGGMIVSKEEHAKKIDKPVFPFSQGGPLMHSIAANVDLRPIGVTGAEAETRCGAARITLNKNVIPFDPQPPMTASGIRVGTPSVTTQGMREGDMKEVASMIARAERDADGSAAAEVGAAVSALVAKHPAYPRG